MKPGFATIQQIAGALSITKRTAERRALSEGWSFEEQAHAGRPRRWYPISKLPAAVREKLYVKISAPPLAVLSGEKPGPFSSEGPRVPAVPMSRAKCRANISDSQVQARDAAAILAREVMSLMAMLDCSENKACAVLAERIERAEVAQHLIQADLDANVKKRKADDEKTRISARSRRLQRMMGLWRAGEKEGDPTKYLVPGKREKEGHDPVHIAAFLRFYCRPSRPKVIEAHRQMVVYLEEQGIPAPSYSVATRIENSLPVTVKYRGRMTGAAWRALKPYVDRDVSMFKANDIWVGDGHTFKARIQSPLHGQAFQPEVTVIIDWVSRKVVGWSVALSESTIAVSAAFRDSQIRTRARPLIYYSDNGAGQTGKAIDHPILGTLARQGIIHETGIPGNPQGRGIIERLWQTLTIPLARTYPTLLTKTADRDHVRKVTQLLAKSQRAGEASPILPSFGQFIEDLQAAIDEYNSGHKHRELSGMTPDQAYQAKLDPDSLVFQTSDEEINQLWMPEEERTPTRGVVRLFGNEYFMKELVDVLEEGEKVRVRYDIHDANEVAIYRSNGDYVGQAIWDKHKRAAFPVPVVEQARLDRAKGIKQRAQREIDRADAELSNTFEAIPYIEPEVIEQPVIHIPETVKVESKKPNFAQMGDYTLLTWLAEHPEDWTPAFRKYFRDQAQTSRTISNALDEYSLWEEVRKQDFRVAV